MITDVENKASVKQYSLVNGQTNQSIPIVGSLRKTLK